MVIVALITSVSALGFFGYSSFKKQKVSNSKATVINPEEIETNKVGLEENIQTENIEMVKEESSNEDAKEAEEVDAVEVDAVEAEAAEVEILEFLNS